MKLVNSRFYSALITLTDYFLLSLLWLVMTLPIVTLFHSTVASIYVIKEWQNGESGRIFYFFFQSFFNSFFKKSIIMIVFIVITSAIYFSFSLMSQLNTINLFSVVSIMVSSIVALGVFIRVALVISNKTKLTLISSLKLAIFDFITDFPKSICYVALLCGTVVLILYMPLFVIFLPVLVTKIICLVDI